MRLTEHLEERIQSLQETHRAERDTLEEKATLLSARRTEEATAAAAADAGAAAAALAEMEAAKVAEVRSAQRAAEATASAAAAAAAADAAAAEIAALKDGAAYLQERIDAIPQELRAAFEEELAEREGAVQEKVRGEVRVLEGGRGGVMGWDSESVGGWKGRVWRGLWRRFVGNIRRKEVWW